MRKIYAFIFSLFALSAAGAARADTPQPPLVRGTYCSASTTDGAWAFTWSYADVFSTCNLVRNALAQRTAAPIQRWTRGYFWGDALNDVYTSCWGGNSAVRGFGAQALQGAFNYANYYNGRGCTFTIN